MVSSLIYVAVFVRGFNQGPPALETSTIPLGYRGSYQYSTTRLSRQLPVLYHQAIEAVISTISLGYRGSYQYSTTRLSRQLPVLYHQAIVCRYSFTAAFSLRFIHLPPSTDSLSTTIQLYCRYTYFWSKLQIMV